MTPEYESYLQSYEWSERRKGCLLRVGNRCEACGTKKKIDIHHLTYAHIFKEPLEDLMALCRPHHEQIENLIIEGKIKRFGDVKLLRVETLRLLTGRTEEKIEKWKANNGHLDREKAYSILMGLNGFEKLLNGSRKDFKKGMKTLVKNLPNRGSLKSHAFILFDKRAKEKRDIPKVSTPSVDANVESVREKMRQRMATGFRKYGVTTERTDLSRKQWLIHAQEEAMDLAVYLEKLIQLEP